MYTSITGRSYNYTTPSFEALTDDFDIKMTKELESEVSEMCNLSQGIEEKGIEIGTLRAIENLMDTLKLTAEQAMAALKIPETERLKYAARLNR